MAVPAAAAVGVRLASRSPLLRWMLVAVVALPILLVLVLLVALGGLTTQAAGAQGTLRPGAVPSDYEALIRRAAQTCPGVTAPLLAAQLDAESGWNPNAVSPVGAKGLVYVSLEDVFLEWVRFLYHLVELENALIVDLWFLDRDLTGTATRPENSLLPLQMRIDTHERFAKNGLESALREDLHRLWSLTTGLCAPDEHVGGILEQLDEVSNSFEAVAARDLWAKFQLRFERLQRSDSIDREYREFSDLFSEVESIDLALLSALKMGVREGVKAFEMFEEDTIAKGRSQLLSSLRGIPQTFHSFYADIARNVPI